MFGLFSKYREEVIEELKAEGVRGPVFGYSKEMDVETVGRLLAGCSLDLRSEI